MDEVREKGHCSQTKESKGPTQSFLNSTRDELKLGEDFKTWPLFRKLYLTPGSPLERVFLSDT